MKQQVINGIKVIVLGLILSAGISYAGNWAPPAGNPPGNNAQGPVNVGTASQIKNGNLGLNNLAVYYNAAILGNASVGDFGNDPATGTLKVATLQHTNTTNTNVCAGQDGVLFLCLTTPPPISFQCSDGMDNDGDGKIDFDGNGDPSKVDPGCYGAQDPDEYNPPSGQVTQCNDGIDNADPEDTLVDQNDPGCIGPTGYDPTDNDETNVITTTKTQIYTLDAAGMPQTSGPCTLCTATNFKIPNNVTSIDVKLWSGGGGGAMWAANGSAPVGIKGGGGGGSGGHIYIQNWPASPGNNLPVTVGKGGKHGIYTFSPYLAEGGTSSMVSGIFCNGGARGEIGPLINGGAGGVCTPSSSGPYDGASMMDVYNGQAGASASSTYSPSASPVSGGDAYPSNLSYGDGGAGGGGVFGSPIAGIEPKDGKNGRVEITWTN